MLKKIALILAITAGTLAGVSCSNISMSDDGGGYTVTITNGTGGYLSSLQVGETVCSDVAPDATCVATYNYRPVDLEITYTGKQVLGYPAAADVYTNKIERTPEVGTTSYEETLVLEDSWVSVWVENTSESYAVDLLGIGVASTPADPFSGFADLTSYGEYTGVTNEEIGFANIDTEVSGTLANTGISNLKIYASVTGEQLTHDVEDEALTVSFSDKIGQGTLGKNNSVYCVVMRNSVIIKGDDTVIAEDDGNGNLVSSGGYLDTAGTNSIDYNTGEVTFTFVDSPGYGSYSVSYRYLESIKYQLKQMPKKGTVKIKSNGTVIAEEVINDDGDYILKGDDIATNCRVHYTDPDGIPGDGFDAQDLAFTFIGALNMEDKAKFPEHITVEYAYEIGNDNAGSLEGAGGIDTGTIDYDTGVYTFTFDTGEIDAEHTVTALHCDYHFPYAVNIDTNFAEPSVATDGAETLVFDADMKTVNTKLAHQHVDTAHAVTIWARYSDPTGAGADEDIQIDANLTTGRLLNGATDVGSINFTTGRVTFTVPDPLDSSYVLSSVWADTYNYFVAGSSNKTWAGFFKKSTFESKSFFVMNMTDANTIAHYCEFTDDDFYYEANDSGSLILNLICGKDDYWSAP